MYTSDEYSGKVGGSKKGWGHSTWSEGVRVAKDAGVKTFVLFHHDPSHDDATLDTIVKQARGKFKATDAAQEGKVYTLPARVSAPRSPAHRYR